MTDWLSEHLENDSFLSLGLGVQLGNTPESYQLALSYDTQDGQPLQIVVQPLVVPTPVPYLFAPLFEVNHTICAKPQGRLGCFQTQYQSHLDLLQNRSVLECLLMRIVSKRGSALHCLFAVHYLIYALS